MSVTQSQIETGLLKLGVQAGMILEVHCSLSSFGHVDDGTLAIINALKNTVGTDGAIIMPSYKHSPCLPLNETDKKMGLTMKIIPTSSNSETLKLTSPLDAMKGEFS